MQEWLFPHSPDNSVLLKFRISADLIGEIQIKCVFLILDDVKHFFTYLRVLCLCFFHFSLYALFFHNIKLTCQHMNWNFQTVKFYVMCGYELEMEEAVRSLNVETMLEKYF